MYLFLIWEKDYLYLYLSCYPMGEYTCSFWSWADFLSKKFGDIKGIGLGAEAE